MQEQKKRKKWPFIVTGLAVVIIVPAIVIQMNLAEAARHIFETYRVGKGNITESVTASGTLAAKDTAEVKLLSDIQIDKVLVERGQEVSEGQEMASLDAHSLMDSYSNLQNSLSSIDGELNALNESKKQESLKATVKGRVKQIFVQENDDITNVVKEKGSLMVLSADGKMQLMVSSEQPVSTDADFSVTLENGKEKTAKIKNKTEQGITVTLTDDGVPMGQTAKLYADGTPLGEGTLQINAPITVLASEGIVKQVHVEENEMVSAGAKLLTFESDNLADAYRQKYDQRIQTEQDLAAVIELIHDPFIRAPHAGVVTSLPAEAGAVQSTDSLSADAASQTQTVSKTSTRTQQAERRVVFELSEGGISKLTIEIDEMDIALVEQGQQADVTIDALTGEVFHATIKEISRVGNAQKGITTYDVILELDEEDARFYEGMNATATITIKKLEDILLLPLELVQEDAQGVFVNVSQTGDTTGADAKRQEIKTGVSDGISVEIISGLNEGDLVVFEKEDSNQVRLGMMRGGMPTPPVATGEGEAV